MTKNLIKNNYRVNSSKSTQGLGIAKIIDLDSDFYRSFFLLLFFYLFITVFYVF